MADEIAFINRNKRKFDVFKYFTEECPSNDCRRVCCKTCKKTFDYSTAAKVSRTNISNLKQHVVEGCTAIILSGDNNDIARATHSKGTTFAQDFNYKLHTCHDLAWMIILGEHRLDIVERPEFIAFAKGLLPKFTTNFDTIQNYCLETYMAGRDTLIKALPEQISLSMDLWQSPRYVGYVFLIASFMDSEWRLHKCILSVILEPNPDSPNTFSRALGICLSDWRLEKKLFSLTINQALDVAAMHDLRCLLSTDNPFLFNGQLLIRSCIYRTLTEIAKKLLCIGESVVSKVRRIVTYVITSDSRKEIFLQHKQELQVSTDTDYLFDIDDRTQWNTTYNMLVAALEMRACFDIVIVTDEAMEGPSEDDWKKVEVLCKYLKFLFDAANAFNTTSAHAAAVFEYIWNIHSKLCDTSVDEDCFTSDLKKTLMETLEKYLKDYSIVLGAGIAMDPRFKMKMVDYSFIKIYGIESSHYIKMVSDGIQQLFDQYVEPPTSVTEFEMYVSETSGKEISELHRYLKEPLIPIGVQGFNVLNWWKMVGPVYPTISKVAWRILSISFSTTIASESIFSTKKKKMDEYRSSLHPKTVEAVICCKDWKASNIL